MPAKQFNAGGKFYLIIQKNLIFNHLCSFQNTELKRQLEEKDKELESVKLVADKNLKRSEWVPKKTFMKEIEELKEGKNAEIKEKVDEIERLQAKVKKWEDLFLAFQN